MQLNIKAAILCDLVRIENNGKHIIIGVYTGNIIFAEQPARFMPTFWIEMVRFADDMSLELKIEAPGLKKPRLATVSVRLDGRHELAHLTLTVPPLEITETGIFRLSMRPLGRGRWQEVIAKAVEFRNSTLPAG
jgi:hypothetical protein